MIRKHRASTVIIAITLVAATAAFAQIHKEYRYTVGPHAAVTVNNQYGPIAVTPVGGSQVIVNAVLHSNRVEIDQSQSGNRVDLVSHVLPGATPDSAQVDYQLQVPAGVSLILHSSTGPLSADGMRSDLTLEGATAQVQVRDVSDAHVHIRTLSGPIMLANINDGHVEITSVQGDVTLQEVDGPLVQVNCSSGRILYDGDFGSGGQYTLMTHSGDIEATVPSYAAIDVSARSLRGHVDNDFPLQPKHTPFPLVSGNTFAGIGGKVSSVISSVKLFSISGKIHLKKK